MIPVMLMGTLVYGIRYTFLEYICTLLVAGGVSTFALIKTSSKTISKLAHPNAPLGYGLCFFNLAFDGFTNATQDSITARYVCGKRSPTLAGLHTLSALDDLAIYYGCSSAYCICGNHNHVAYSNEICHCANFGSSFSGVLIDEHGRVQAIWGSFSTQIISGANGLPLLINGVKRPMPFVRILEVELYPTLLSKARSFGLSDNWIQRSLLYALRDLGILIDSFPFFHIDIRVKEPTLESLCRGRKQYEPPRYMTINTAIEQLLEVEEKHGGSGEFQQLLLS
ncbi:hypothetical protein REPUB_Repub04eG0216200 [Reevesia pubescens]